MRRCSGGSSVEGSRRVASRPRVKRGASFHRAPGRHARSPSRASPSPASRSRHPDPARAPQRVADLRVEPGARLEPGVRREAPGSRSDHRRSTALAALPQVGARVTEKPAPRRRGLDAHRPARPPLLVPRRLVEVNTTSGSPTASAMELTPTSTQRWTAAASRSWTRISCPLFLRHREPPMFPAPMNPTFIWRPPVLHLSAARPSQGPARGSPRGMDARPARESGRIRNRRGGAAPTRPLPGAAPTAGALPAHGGAEDEGVHRPFVAAGRPGAACLEAEGRGGGEPPPHPGAKGAARALPHREGRIGRHHAGA